MFMIFFFFNDTATTEIYTLSLHDALPISLLVALVTGAGAAAVDAERVPIAVAAQMRRAMCLIQGGDCLGDRKSTRLNSSHANISYAVFCLKKKKNKEYNITFFLKPSIHML